MGMLVGVCLLASNFNVHAMSEKLALSPGQIGI
jgi:hypothetical protein